MECGRSRRKMTASQTAIAAFPRTSKKRVRTRVNSWFGNKKTVLECGKPFGGRSILPARIRVGRALFLKINDGTSRNPALNGLRFTGGCGVAGASKGVAGGSSQLMGEVPLPGVVKNLIYKLNFCSHPYTTLGGIFSSTVPHLRRFREDDPSSSSLS